MNRSSGETLRGVKFYKSIGQDEVEILRVIDIDNNSTGKAVAICKSDVRDEIIRIGADELASSYTKIIPDGCVAFTIGKENNANGSWFEDVIVATYTAEDIGNNMACPSVVCRQLVKDFLYNMGSGIDNHDYVGVCVTKDIVPQNMNYLSLLSVNSVSLFSAVNYYINDSINDIVSMLSSNALKKINKVLESNFIEYINSTYALDMGQKNTKGHCRDLKTLLEINNYQFHHDSVYNIVTTTLNIKDSCKHVVEEDGKLEYDVLNDDMLIKLSRIYQKKITKAITLEYDQDISLDRLNKNNLLLIRDVTDTLYLIHITTDGEYLKRDLDNLAVNDVYDSIRVVNKYGSKSQNRK